MTPECQNYDRSSWRCAARATLVLATLALLDLQGTAAAAPQEDPWRALVDLRQRLEATGAETWDFQQTYVPAGFSTGERETGRVILGLPRCVRWDYRQPYPKSFLLCGTELHAWNPGETMGQVYTLDQAQPGLDLLLLSVEVLRTRYDASLERERREQRIVLSPLGTATGLLREAELVLTPGGERLQRLAYLDSEGNRTTFDFTNPRATRGRAAFSPPRGLRWESGGNTGRQGH